MRNRNRKAALLAALVIATLAIAAAVQAGEHPAATTATTKATSEHPKATTAATKATSEHPAAGMMEAPKSGPEHAWLQKCSGKWNATVKMMGMPGAEPMVSHGVEDVASVCNGLFIETAYHGTDPNMPFEGHGMDGYDQGKKKYCGYWCDSWGTGFMTYEGTVDAKGVFTCTGTMTDPKTGATQASMLQSTMPDDNTRIFKMWQGTSMTGPPMMEITYTRAAPVSEASRK